MPLSGKVREGHKMLMRPPSFLFLGESLFYRCADMEENIPTIRRQCLTFLASDLERFCCLLHRSSTSSLGDTIVVRSWLSHPSQTPQCKLCQESACPRIGVLFLPTLPLWSALHIHSTWTLRVFSLHSPPTLKWKQCQFGYFNIVIDN